MGKVLERMPQLPYPAIGNPCFMDFPYPIPGAAADKADKFGVSDVPEFQGFTKKIVSSFEVKGLVGDILDGLLDLNSQVVT